MVIGKKKRPFLNPEKVVRDQLSDNAVTGLEQLKEIEELMTEPQ